MYVLHKIGCSLHYQFITFQSGLTSLCFVDDLCQILGMFSLNSIGCVTSAVLLAFWREIQPTDVCKWPTCSNLHTERFEVIF